MAKQGAQLYARLLAEVERHVAGMVAALDALTQVRAASHLPSGFLAHLRIQHACSSAPLSALWRQGSLRRKAAIFQRSKPMVWHSAGR